MGTSTEDLSARAKQLIAERRYQEAVRACRRILLSRPAMTEVRVLLGMALLALSRHDEVRAEMMAVLRDRPEVAPAHRLLGEAHLRDGQVDKARDSFTRALELDPSDEEARELLSEVAAEEPVITTTIDRWFDPEAVATVQTESPLWDEVVTGSVRQYDSNAPGDLAGEATRAHAPSVPPPPQSGSQMPPPPAAPPPSYMPPSPVGPSSGSAFPAPPDSQFPPAPPEAAQTPGYSSPASSIPPRPMAPAFVPEELTAAQTPQAKIATDPGDLAGDGPLTNELNLSEVDEIRPPISHSPYHDPAPAFAPSPPVDFAEDAPTYARSSDDDDFAVQAATSAFAPLEDLPGERTIARSESVAPPAFAPGGPADYAAPPSAAPRPLPAQRPAPVFAPGGPADYAAPPAVDPAGPMDYSESPVPGAGMPQQPAQAAPMPGASPSAHPVASSRAAVPDHQGQQAQKKKGSRALFFAIGIAVPLFIGILAFLGVFYWLDGRAEERIQTALVVAEEDGRRTSLDRVIDLADDHDGSDPEDVALRARLQATLLIDHGVPEAAAATEVLLAMLEGEELHHRDAIIASAYFALARGDIGRARGAITLFPLQAQTNPEVRRTLAVVAAAAADYENALEASRGAREARPTSPRYVALNAYFEARAGDIQAATTALDGIPDGNASGDVRVARARILKLANSDPDAAAAEATAVLDQLADTATAPQRGWAHLIKAWHASTHGAPASAIEEGRAARALRPPGDEQFTLDLAEVFVDAQAYDEAAETLALLPEEGIREQRRARLRVATFLGQGDIEAAVSALTEAGTGAHATLMRGRVAEATNEIEAALGFYQQAREADPALNIRASARLGAIEARRGNNERAAILLEPVAQQAPANVEVVPVLVEVLIALRRVDDAGGVVERAFRVQRPEGVAIAVPLLAARANLEGAKNEWPAAMATWGLVAESLTDSADVHRSLGEAALRAGDQEVASRAFARVLELAANDGQALAGLAFLTVAGGSDLGAMKAAIVRAEEAGGEGPFLNQAKARVMVFEGKGWEAVLVLRRMARRSREPGLLNALGQANLQAFKDTAAARVFRRVIDIDADNPEALLGIVIARTRSASTAGAQELLDQAKSAAEARGLPPSFMARLEAARAGIAFERDDFTSARTIATAALALDEDCADAHMYVAAVTMALNGNPVESLRRALTASPPSVEAMGLLVVEIASARPSEEVCALGRRYLAAAPRGFDAADVRRAIRRCR
ncbi:MAG: tetratricopeptide repeat protein [Deltaproteobacteria bacterium]|nr:tetratricopeptide repeat protein [Deltaproteobacteria bacterium]